MIKITEADQRFYVKESTIPDAGLGLFAKHPIPKGSFLEIIGVLVERGSVADQCTSYANNYKFGSSQEGWVIVPMGYAGLINHTDSKEKRNVEIRNVRAKIPSKKRKEYRDVMSYSGEAVYFFLRDVPKDEEILGNYGHEWDKQARWMKEYDNKYKKSENEWIKFLSHGLYNLPVLAEKIPITDELL